MKGSWWRRVLQGSLIPFYPKISVSVDFACACSYLYMSVHILLGKASGWTLTETPGHWFIGGRGRKGKSYHWVRYYKILHFPGGAAGLPASESLESCCTAVSSEQMILRQHFHSNYGLKTFVIFSSSFLSPAAPKPKLLFQLIIGSRKKRSMAFPRAKMYGLSSVICSPIKPVWSRSLEMLFRELLLKAGNNEVLFYTIDLLNLSG